jgi:hypothetical protein
VNVVVFVLIVALLALVVAIVGAPLRRRAHGAPEAEAPEDPRSADLAAAREAKYQEIRDAELDYRTGKLSREDYEAVDAGLRAEAIEILDMIEREDSGEG